ncbi:hypothetical protein [Corynebacterium argentoratense]|uniref:hypothetical protein n=1 Tax=Corynebacterium argentoratense TaxID=42817 RepID=UPI00137932A4|nr:hypothetical protein [Corynebacterium argentoratense]
MFVFLAGLGVAAAWFFGDVDGDVLRACGLWVACIAFGSVDQVAHLLDDPGYCPAIL